MGATLQVSVNIFAGMQEARHPMWQAFLVAQLALNISFSSVLLNDFCHLLFGSRKWEVGSRKFYPAEACTRLQKHTLQGRGEGGAPCQFGSRKSEVGNFTRPRHVPGSKSIRCKDEGKAAHLANWALSAEILAYYLLGHSTLLADIQVFRRIPGGGAGHQFGANGPFTVFGNNSFVGGRVFPFSRPPFGADLFFEVL